ncbi:class I SAM-dependent methyltransferase [Paenibacillus lautus]|uniref:class I SAM-dependent methyltransferase n=1 Tax=Paenibacillus lautus TaxID=1401 RepID=UPI001596B395|nr:class I SAM-dependent methyltransferase [Paenibacillus lautus]
MEWWESNYDSLDYIKTYKKNHDTKTYNEINFILRNISLRREDIIVDLCCGYGRHAIEFALKGFRTIGIDLSEPLLEYAKSSASARNAKVEWIRSDYRNVRNIHANLVVNLFNSFGYMNNDEENYKLFDIVNGILAEDGRFFMDVFHRERCVNNLRPQEWEDNDQNIILREQDYEETTMRLVRKTTIYDKTHSFTKSQRVSSIRTYSIDEIELAMNKRNLKIEEVFGDYLGSEFIPNESKRLCIIAKKGSQKTFKNKN